MVTPGITSLQEGLGMAKADDLMRQQVDHASSKDALRLAGASERRINRYNRARRRHKRSSNPTRLTAYIAGTAPAGRDWR